MSAEKSVPAGAYLPLAACIGLCVLGPLSGLAQSGLSPIMPQITEHFASDPNAGLLVRAMVSGLSAAMIFGALASGFLSERVGQLRLLTICLVLYGLMGAIPFLLDDLYLMVASRIVLGAVTAAAGVLAMALITTRVAPNARERWLGYYVLMATVGTVLLMGVVGGLAQFGWRYGVLVYLVGVPLALYVALTFPRGEAAAAAAAPVAPRGAAIPWGKVLFGLLCGAVATTTGMYLPFYFAAIGYGAPETVATVLVFQTSAGGATAFAYGWFRKFLKPAPLLATAMSTCAAGLLIAIATDNYAAVVIGSTIYGAGMGIMTPTLFGGVAAATPVELRPRMLGFVRAGFYAGPLVAQVLLEIVISQAGAAAAVGGIAAICLLIVLLSAVMRREFVPVPQ